MSKFILVSQRQKYCEERKETIDSLDQAWTVLIQKLGYQCLPVPNRTQNLGTLFNLEISGVILSGGGMIDSDQAERDKTERQMLKIAIQSKLPILGVCRGAQLIAHEFKWNLKKIANHVRTRHVLITNQDLKIKISPPKDVNSFHEYGLDLNDMTDLLEWIFKSQDNFIECFLSKKEKVLGVMWHPEREHPFSDFDLKLLSSFFNGDQW